MKLAEYRWGRPVVFLMGISVSVICLWIAFRKLNWYEMFTHIRKINGWALLGALIVVNLVIWLLADRIISHVIKKDQPKIIASPRPVVMAEVSKAVQAEVKS